MGSASESVVGRLGRYASANLGYGAVNTISGALIAGLLYRLLGDDFAVYALVTTSALYLNPLDDSLGLFLVTRIAKRSDDTEREARAAAHLAMLSTGLFAIGLGFAIFLLFADDTRRAEWGVLSGVLAVTYALAGWRARVCEGREHYLKLRALQSVIAVIKLTAVAVLAALEVDRVGVYLSLFAVLYAGQAALLTDRSLWTFQTSTQKPTARDYARVIAFVRPFLVAKGTAIASYRIDLWLIQIILGTSATSAYAAAEAVARVAQQSLEVVKGALIPIATRLSGHGENDRDLLLVAGRASFLVAGGLSVMIFASLEPLLRIWFGEVDTLTRWAASFLLIFVVSTALRSATQAVVASRDQFGIFTSSFAVAGLLNLGLSLILIFTVGAWGAALGTALAGLYLLIVNSRQVERLFSLESSFLTRRLILPAIAVAGLGMSIRWVPWHLVGLPWLELILAAAASWTVFFGAFAFFLLTPSERDLLNRRGSLAVSPTSDGRGENTVELGSNSQSSQYPGEGRS